MSGLGGAIVLGGKIWVDNVCRGARTILGCPWELLAVVKAFDRDKGVSRLPLKESGGGGPFAHGRVLGSCMRDGGKRI